MPATCSRAAAIAALVLGAWLVSATTGCGPPPPPAGVPARDVLMPRYLSARRDREQRAAGVEADVLLWSRIGADRLPAADGRLLVMWPDACRLRLGSLFGTAIDLALHGDSLDGVLPSERAVLSIDAARDSIGMRAPGAFAVRVLSATWLPPAAAWEQAVPSDSALELRWVEAEDSLALGIGHDGMPRTLLWTTPGHAALHVRYGSWTNLNGARWPDRIRLEEPISGTLIELRATRLASSALTPDRLRVRMPADAVRWTLGDVMERIGAMR